MNRFDPTTADVVAALSTPAPEDRGSLDRRRFLQAAAVTGAVTMLPAWLADQAAAATPLGASDGVLVLIMMNGGNDGMSMVPPYADGNYRQIRGRLAIGADRVLRINDQRGLHPNLPFVKGMWDQGRVAVIDGVGHPQPDLSHFMSMARWMTASTSTSNVSTGWLGRYVDGLGSPDAFHSIAMGSSVPLTLSGNRSTATALPSSAGGLLTVDPDPVYQRQQATIHQIAGGSTGLGALADSLARSASSSIGLATSVAGYYQPDLPSEELAAQLTLCARLINANLGTRVLMVSYGDFDSHANQASMHGDRMTELNRGLQAFFETLDPGFLGRTLVLTSSEFGRRPWANESGGTDHGTSNTLLAIGGGVNGGFYGQLPTLGGHRRWDNFETTVDFRQVYGNVVVRWLGADSAEVIGADYADMGFLRAPSGTAGGSSGSISGQPGGSRFQLARLYSAYFRRMPDEEGMDFWLAQRRNGLRLESVSAEFARSAEFAATYGALSNAGFIDLIYANVLRRTPDAAGRAYWIGLLDQGEDRGKVMQGFSESTEFVTLTTPEIVEAEKTGPIGRLYRAYLDREGDRAGLEYWLGTSTPLLQISESFASSNEFVQRYGALSDSQFVDQIYRNVMKREADEAGRNFWTQQLGRGQSRGMIMLSFSNSSEFKTTVSKR
ncbi:MAG: DUF4214 domain-containing protein [Acidimicrobiales bacterium]